MERMQERVLVPRSWQLYYSHKLNVGLCSRTLIFWAREETVEDNRMISQAPALTKLGGGAEQDVIWQMISRKPRSQRWQSPEEFPFGQSHHPT